MNSIKDKTLLLLSSIGAAAFIFLTFVRHKPNRIAQGIKLSTFDFLGTLSLIVLIFWVILMALSFYEKKYKNLLVFIFTCLLLISIFWTLQMNTGGYTSENPAARISLSSGFYIQIFCIYMIFSTYTHRITQYKSIKVLGFLVVFVILSYFILSGGFDDLSLIKEYNIKRTQFYNNLRIHAMLTFGSVITGIIIAVPLGFLAYSKSKFEGTIMVPLSIVETIPSISLFGILLVPLSGLENFPFLMP